MLSYGKRREQSCLIFPIGKEFRMFSDTMDLIANMPAMIFSKDASTGKYLACNQAFAEYAHKETPEGSARWGTAWM